MLAGHEDLRTTQRYLHAERSDLVQAMETFVSVRVSRVSDGRARRSVEIGGDARSGWRKHDAAEDVGGQLVLSFGLLESLLPIGGSELKHSLSRPCADQAEQVPEVAVGLDAVEARAGEERDEHGVDGGAIVAADEEPVRRPRTWRANSAR